MNIQRRTPLFYTMTLEEMIEDFNRFLEEENLPQMCARELMAEEIEFTEYQKRYLEEFTAVWEDLESA